MSPNDAVPPRRLLGTRYGTRPEKLLVAPRTRLLHIRPPMGLDQLAIRARDAVQKLYGGSEEKVIKFINDNTVGTSMTRASSNLDGSGALDEANRLLLSDRDIYGGVVLELLERIRKSSRSKIEAFLSDRDGFRVAVLNHVEADGSIRDTFIENLARGALRNRGADPDRKVGEKRVIDLLVAELRAHPIPLAAGGVQDTVDLAHERILRDSNFPELVDAYVTRGEVDSTRFTKEIKDAMVAHLVTRGVKIENDEQKDRFRKGGYDEYFAMAYEKAVSSAAGDSDPIVAASTKGATVAPWDFTVDTFEAVEAQGIVRENILAAGALDYVYELGERLGIFRLVDALTLSWAAGAIDVVDGPCAANLYRYWKLRDQRSDPSERGLVYKRVLNKGETEALDRMVVNERFEALWGALAEKVVEYRSKVETTKAAPGDSLMVSRAPIYQAVRDLQYNLTEFCTGMAHMQVREMYAQLREAMELLSDPEIIDHFAGGKRKTMWTAIERLSKIEFGEAPNINAVRIAAVEGNAVFRFISNFSPGAVTEDEFQRFLESAEAWIIAKASDESVPTPEPGDEEAEDEEDGTSDDEVV